MLTGAGVGPEVPSFFDNMTDESNVGHALVALDVAAFADPGAFAARMERLVDGLHGVPPAAGSPGVRVPGEARAERAARAARDGVPLAAGTVEALDRLVRDLGVPGL